MIKINVLRSKYILVSLTLIGILIISVGRLESFLRYLCTKDTASFQKQKFNKLPVLHDSACAVVSSSGALLEAELGTMIDSYSTVIRFNFATPGNFVRNVGNRTDVRIFGWWKNISGSAGASPPDGGKRITLNNPAGSDKVYIFRSDYRIPRENIKLDKDLTSLEYMIWYPEEYNTRKLLQYSTYNNWMNRHGPREWSTGFWSLQILPQICNEITLFGFLKSSKTRQHFDGTIDETESNYRHSNPHPMDWEKEIIDNEFLLESPSFDGLVKKINVTALSNIPIYSWSFVYTLKNQPLYKVKHWRLF